MSKYKNSKLILRKCTMKHFGQKMDKKCWKGTQQGSVGYLDTKDGCFNLNS